MRRTATAAAVAGSVLIGGAFGYTQLGGSSAAATTPTAKTVSPAQPVSPATATASEADGHGFGHQEAVSDLSVAAKAIGITESDLTTALNAGQTIAQVAKIHSVAAQTVIDALVADGNSELASEVASGQLTQAQADQMKAEITQRATAQVNGTLRAHGQDEKPGASDSGTPEQAPSSPTGTSA